MLYGKKKLKKREGGRAGGVGWGGVSSATSFQLRNPKIYEHCSTLGGFVTCVSEKLINYEIFILKPMEYSRIFKNFPFKIYF
jgi:hypothetical protein